MSGGGRQAANDRSGDELMSVSQVLEELGGVARRTFYRWRELGTAPKCLRLPNGELRIRRSDFTDWLDELQEVA
jgi:predicted DNA-binding transcriptional regulator AlpA